MKKISRDLTKRALTVTVGKSSCWPASRLTHVAASFNGARPSHVMLSRHSKAGARKSGVKQPSSRRAGKSK